MLREQHPFWSGWAAAVIRHPVLVILCAVVVAAILAYQAWRTPKDLSFTGMLDENNVELKHFRETVNEFGSEAMLVLLLEGDAAEVDRAVELLLEALPKLSQIRSVTPPADPEWLIDRAPWVWPRPMFDTVLRAVTTGENAQVALNNVNGADAVIRKSMRPVPEAAVLSIGLYRNPLDIAMGGGDFFRIEAETERILDEADCKVTRAFTGLMAAGAQDQRSVMGRIKLLTPLTLIAVLILLMTVERRLSRVLLAGVALSFAVAISFGLTGLTRGTLTITVTFFGMLLLGLGIDFAIHLLVALRDARSHGKSPEECIRFGIRRTATAIALGGTSTALAFGLVALAPEPGARDMGFAALYGLLAALVLMLTFLPAAWLLLERRHTGLDSPSRFVLPGLHAVVGVCIRRPWTTLIIGSLLTAFGLAGIPRYELERDLEKIISRKVTAFKVDDRLAELFGVSPVTYLAPVESLDQAREWARELLKMDDIGSVTSVADIIQPDVEERSALVAEALAGVPDDLVDDPLVQRLRRATEAGLITVETIPRSLSNGLVSPGGRLAISIAPKENVLDAEVLDEQYQRVTAIAPTATGMPVIIKLVVIGSRDYIPIMIPGILAVVTLVLLIVFRNLRDVFLALLPVLMGTAISFGVFLWLGIQMSVLTTVIVPVILGLGVDDGIHVVERLRQYHTRTDDIIHQSVEGVGRAIFLTTATTCVSFIGLLFTDHAGLEGIAVFMLIGIPACFVTSITVLPAAAKLMRPKADTA